MVNDIRWKQRFDQYLNSLKKLDFVVEEEKIRRLNEIEQAGKIQYFEMSYELSWKMLKDYANQIAEDISNKYYPEFVKLAAMFTTFLAQNEI